MSSDATDMAHLLSVCKYILTLYTSPVKVSLENIYYFFGGNYGIEKAGVPDEENHAVAWWCNAYLA
ncbi:hypothetical protein SDC9_211207 [bioreactor metagenome]|uniref:Uncharacterized protein n=1 Tax=bioreactor metagenome TaxID=1076179 RepID=A0A645JIE6_9ZZZZ